MIGIIGGTGVYGLLTDAREVKVFTPYGSPSDVLFVGKLAGVDVAFIPRHGRRHTIPPHRVNYRANIWAMKELGVERIIAIHAVGSLREEMEPGDIVFPDQFINWTWRREDTFYEGGKVAHISTADPFCPELRSLASNVAKELGIKYHDRGTYIVVEGPRFSTRAESRMFRMLGADIIGMTLYPEIVLARELGMCYLSISAITDYDVWAEKPVDTKEVIDTMKKNEGKVKRILEALLPRIPEKRSCGCADVLKSAFVG